MVSKEELEDILHKEEIEKIWKGIENSKRIADAEADKKYWKKALYPFYDEMAPNTPAIAVGHVKIENEEDDPIWAEFDMIEAYGLALLAGMGLIYIGIGILFLIGMAFSIHSNECVVGC